MTRPDPTMLGARAEAMIEALAAISVEPHRLVRLFLTPEHRRAADLVAQWMREVGMAVSEDALGTVRGHHAGEPRAKRLIIGSHIDTVIDAGRYDGTLGVIAGILAVEHVAQRRLPFGIDVVAFGDEEGSRFPVNMSSSSAAAGVFDPALLSAADRDGITLEQALESYGLDPASIPAAVYRDAAAYVEVHIEQGPVLEQANQPLGVVTGIVGQTRARVTATGEAGHAGTVPMGLRHDALAGAAELVLAAERIARERGIVATVGHVEARPGAPNIIPGEVSLTLDMRALDDEARRGALRDVQAAAWAIVEARGLQIAFEPYHDASAFTCAPALQEQLAAAVAALGCQPLRLPSGAGHDAQMMGKLCPSAMLFVRCRGGISHNPAEHASMADMGLAIAALIGFIESFDPSALG